MATSAISVPFSSRVMTPEEFRIYRSRLNGLFNTEIRGDSAQLKVVGYGDEAKAAIRACNDDGADVIEVGWNLRDNMLSVMFRIEAKLRIPVRHWRLAGEGQVISPNTNVSRHPLFSPGQTVELFLLPDELEKEYKEANSEEQVGVVWKHLEPGATDSTDPLEQARAKFQLANPVASTGWKAYVEHREAAETSMQEMLELSEYVRDEGLHPVLDQIRNGTILVLKDAGLEEEQQYAVADGILPIGVSIEDSWGDDVQEVDVHSRIYSPTRPAAVDVSFTYWHKTRWESVEFNCEVRYSIINPIKKKGPSNLSNSMRGSNMLFKMALDSFPPGRRWYPSYITGWGLTGPDVDAIHLALFGPVGFPGNVVDKVDTVRLLLAAVGIPFRVAREEGGADRQNPGRVGAVEWEWDYDDWIGFNIRKACGVPLQRDAGWRPKIINGSEYEDEDEDDEDEGEGEGDSEDEDYY
ncbi:hypothetical protein PHLCEN_2v11190 [Hermanssonia centrifuga]|uniref:Uncharacterized protein n=1 Tax=Hermanssonia centrifuga TaxID=98765 RepID=A0A2R6NKR8_9APHY|nr:hypothetical protein PHLCEN_2v11190 [Hermanssonia centrifuga]